jgi:hypothetical protein
VSGGEQLILPMFLSAQTGIFNLVEKKCLLTTSELDTAIQNVRIGISLAASLSQPLLSSPFPLHSLFQTYTVMVASVIVVSSSFTRSEN